MDRLAEILVKLQVVRRLMILATFVLTFRVYAFVFTWLGGVDHVSLDVAAVVAALLTPVSTLLGHLVKTYAAHEHAK